MFADVPRDPPTRLLRQFAAILGLIALGAGIFERGPIWLVLVGLIVGLTGMIEPSVVRPIFVGWMLAVSPIRWLVSRLLLALVYFGLLTPIGLWLRFRGHDPMRRSFNPLAESYWEPKGTPSSSASYFRQH